jgi:hypothetical protein
MTRFPELSKDQFALFPHFPDAAESDSSAETATETARAIARTDIRIVGVDIEANLSTMRIRADARP